MGAGADFSRWIKRARADVSCLYADDGTFGKRGNGICTHSSVIVSWDGDGFAFAFASIAGHGSSSISAADSGLAWRFYEKAHLSSCDGILRSRSKRPLPTIADNTLTIN